MNLLESGKEQEINDLVNKLGNSDGFIREKARLALTDIGKKAVPSLITAMESKQQQVRWEAAKTLVIIADPLAIPALIKGLKDEIFDIRWLAAEALIAIGIESIAPLLQALVNQTDESFLQEGAHHVIAYIIHSNSKASEVNEILKPVEIALGGITSRVTAPAAAKAALTKLEKMK